MNDAQKHKEKRRFLRHPIHAPIQLDVERQKNLKAVESSDLSLGGLSFLWAKRLSKGEVLRIGIPVKQKLFEVIGRVVYAKEDISFFYWEQQLIWPVGNLTTLLFQFPLACGLYHNNPLRCARGIFRYQFRQSALK